MLANTYKDTEKYKTSLYLKTSKHLINYIMALNLPHPTWKPFWRDRCCLHFSSRNQNTKTFIHMLGTKSLILTFGGWWEAIPKPVYKPENWLLIVEHACPNPLKWWGVPEAAASKFGFRDGRENGDLHYICNICLNDKYTSRALLQRQVPQKAMSMAPNVHCPPSSSSLCLES